MSCIVAEGDKMPTIHYRPEGVCAKGITIETEGDTIANVEFTGGCDGNLKAIGRLIKGQNIDTIIDILDGNTCGPRSTSCADQLAQALKTVER